MARKRWAHLESLSALLMKNRHRSGEGYNISFTVFDKSHFFMVNSNTVFPLCVCKMCIRDRSSKPQVKSAPSKEKKSARDL